MTYFMGETKMRCNDINKIIPFFLNNKLNQQEAEPFLRHLEHCHVCMEELEIQYLLEVGMKRLEDGGNFNLKEEMNDKIKQMELKIRRQKILLKVKRFVELLVMITFLSISIYWLID